MDGEAATTQATVTAPMWATDRSRIKDEFIDIPPFSVEMA